MDVNKTKELLENAAGKARKFLTPTRYILLGFAALILLGTILLVLPFSTKDGKSMGFVPALFSATSSVCVTGLTVLDPGTRLSVFGQIVMLFLIQAGGLGFMTTTTFMLLLAGRKIGLRERMNIQESLSQDNLKGVVLTTKKILAFTFAAELIGAFVLMIRFVPVAGGKGIWMAVFTSVSAFCNAGLDILGSVYGPFASFTQLKSDPLVLVTTAALIISGGLGFLVFSDVLGKKKNKPLHLHTSVALYMTAGLIIFGTTAFLIAEYDNPGTLGGMSFGDKFLNAFFQSVTARTAGFNAVQQGALSENSKMITVMLMFVGASPASTGGGVKTTTIFVILMLLVSVFRDRDDIAVGKKNIGSKAMKKAGALVITAVFVVIIQSLIIWDDIGGITGMSFLDCVFESTSAFGTVGLSTGITTSLGTGSLLTLCLTMFIGRLGPVTIGSAIMRGSTRGPEIKYPDAKILIG